ncbi:S-type pyocin domain-containing protein [Pseudomonas sp. A34-9]|uniref:S-type pyocin domain-containing protein n=1 Tax=Pseudomonas sp. A34-9 TaxID=3034675 RepID=UPI00240DD5F0|nr:S-type pyocin domain-containing protein [Pseudomonas sp. A34-9]
MQKPPTWELTEAVHTTAVAPIHIPVASGTSTTIPNSGMFGPHNFGPHNLVIINSRSIDATKAALAQEYQNRTQQLPQTLEHELAATRLEGTTHPLPPAETVIRELGVRATLLQRKTAELQQKMALANQFYGSDPRSKNLIEFYQKAVTLQNPVMPGGIAIQAWTASYRAAHDTQLLAQSIHILNQQQVEVHKWLDLVKANDQAQSAAAEAQRLAAERARIAAEQQRQRELAEAARREQEQVRAREQARLAALAQTQRQAAEQARIAAEAAARQLASEQAKLTALAERQAKVQRLRIEQEKQLEIEKARLEQQQKAARATKSKRQRLARKQAKAEARQRAEQARVDAHWHTQTQARWNNPEFAYFGSLAAFGPAFSGTLGAISHNPLTKQALRTSLRSAVTIATAAISTSAVPVLVGFAALFVPSELGNGDLFAASVPLSDLAPDLEDDLYELARIGADVDLPVRLGSRTIGNKVEVVVVSTDGVTVPSKVPVVSARFDALKNVYVSSASATDAKGPVITWTPLLEPPNPSTQLPLADPDLPIYEGANVTPDSGRIDPFPEMDLYGFGGWITVFPVESGIPPIFTMFRDRRQDPGFASGIGQPVSGNWLGAAATPQGAPIPMQIADKLRGREFSSFRAFRRAFWKAVGNEKALFDQFSRLNKTDLRDGLAPSATPSEQAGKRKKFEIHHIKPISEGGAVYDVTNLTVLTPKQHIELHSKGGM